MVSLARLPTIDALDPSAAVPRVPRLRTRYYAFLSYSHKDKELADWLHRELEKFRVPHSIAGKLTANGVVPRRLTPIFRDQQDLSAGGDLAQEIKAALAASQFLVVLCSPTAAKSRWTNQEIECFKRTRPEGCVLAAVVAGEPFASDIPAAKPKNASRPRCATNMTGAATRRRSAPSRWPPTSAKPAKAGASPSSSSSPECSELASTSSSSARRRGVIGASPGLPPARWPAWR